MSSDGLLVILSWVSMAVLRVAGSKRVRQWIQDKATKETKADRVS